MKAILKITVLSAFLLSTSMNTGVYAQQSNGEQNGTFSFGSRTGLVVGYFDMENACGFDADLRGIMPHCVTGLVRSPGVDFNITVYGNYAFNNFFSVQTELNFMRHHVFGRARSHGVANYVVELNYYGLGIPLLAKVNLNIRRTSFGFLLGPHVLIPLGRAEFYYRFDGRVFQQNLSVNNTSIFGITMGLFCKRFKIRLECLFLHI
ncbi:MAG: outer membrane beta-barrel protein [Bacteroidales bacterium]|nr:outer membrane beta-barrel protein [Bacteroidales bacterium]